MKEQKQMETAALQDVVQVVYITPQNASFECVHDFLRLSMTCPDENGTVQTKVYVRVFLHRAFPFDFPYAYISVLDTDMQELGMIRDIGLFDEETASMLRDELDRKYYTPVIRKILSVKDKLGYSYWKVLTDEGEMDFTLHDAFRSLMKVDNNRIFVHDIDGNRYEIPDVEQLDHKSFRKIELFL